METEGNNRFLSNLLLLGGGVLLGYYLFSPKKEEFRYEMKKKVADLTDEITNASSGEAVQKAKDKLRMLIDELEEKYLM